MKFGFQLMQASYEIVIQLTNMFNGLKSKHESNFFLSPLAFMIFFPLQLFSLRAWILPLAPWSHSDFHLSYLILVRRIIRRIIMQQQQKENNAYWISSYKNYKSESTNEKTEEEIRRIRRRRETQARINFGPLSNFT